MSRLPHVRCVSIVTLLAPMLLIAAIRPAVAQTRHHLAFAVGYLKHLSDDLKVDAPTHLDFTNAAHAQLQYRYSVRPRLDLTIDSQGTASTDNVGVVDLRVLNSFFGPGVRSYLTDGASRPYVQANVFAVSERLEAESNGTKVTQTKSGAGFGAAFGMELRATPLLSFPLQVHYLYSKPADDVSGIGVDAGIAFDFGTPLAR